MKTEFIRKGIDYIWIDGADLLLAAAYLGLVLKLPFDQMSQTGAAVFPIVI